MNESCNENTAVVNKKELLTHSRMACARRCLRQHYYRYELGISRAAEAAALRFGKAYHLGLQAWRNGEPAEEAISQAVAGYDECPSYADPEAWAIERITLATLLAGYFWRYENENLIFLEVEKAFELPLRNPEGTGVSRTFSLAGKIDALVELDTRQYVLETKTTSEDISEDSAYWLRLRVDQQISLYMLAARQMQAASGENYNPAAVIYDVTRKPTIRPKQVPLVDDEGIAIVLDGAGQRVKTADGKRWRTTGDTAKGYVAQVRKETDEEYGDRLWQDILDRPDFYYQRREIPRLEDDLLDFQHEVWQQAGQLRDCQNNGRWFRNVGQSSCGYCEYSELCLQSVRVDHENIPSGFVMLEDKFPELSE
jgi:hypothetical protein